VRLYSGTITGLVDDSTQNRIASKLSSAFFNHFRSYPSQSEANSWKNSLRAICQVFAIADLEDNGVLLEYQLPQTSKRLDCIVTGRDRSEGDSAVIVELKQWDRCPEAFGDKVVTFIGGDHRDVLHPSAQVHQYHTYLQDGHTAFHQDDPVRPFTGNDLNAEALLTELASNAVSKQHLLRTCGHSEAKWTIHSPKNLASSIIIEAAELLEYFQWQTETDSAAYDIANKDKVAEEIADVAIYLFELADNLGIDLLDAIDRKLVINCEKYPVEKAKGSAAKYTDLR
jgi:NTP pyrophosphatase (non-canonical NTP hydrolase)